MRARDIQELTLADVAIKGGTLPLLDEKYGRKAGAAWLACAAVDEIALLEITGVAIGAEKISQAAAAGLYRIVQGRFNFPYQIRA